MLSFLGTQLLNKSAHVETKVYVKATNAGLMLMIDRNAEECDRLKLLSSRLKYPDKLINSAFTRFVDLLSNETCTTSRACILYLAGFNSVAQFNSSTNLLSLLWRKTCTIAHFNSKEHFINS